AARPVTRPGVATTRAGCSVPSPLPRRTVTATPGLPTATEGKPSPKKSPTAKAYAPAAAVPAGDVWAGAQLPPPWFRSTPTGLLPDLAVMMPGRPPPLRSASRTSRGPFPPTASTEPGDWKCPGLAGSLYRTVTVFEPALDTTRSGKPSPSTSPATRL